MRSEQETLRNYVQDIEEVAATLQPDGQTCAARQALFKELIDRFEGTQEPMHQQMVQVMRSFRAGLFVGEGQCEPIRDNLDLERWFRLPKSHERGSTVTATRGFVSSWRGPRWCMLWTSRRHIPSRSPQKNSSPIEQPPSRRAKCKRGTAARS